MTVRPIHGDLIRWTDSFVSERTVEMIIKGNAMETHLQGLPVSPILCAIDTSGLVKWVEESEPEAEGQSFGDNLGRVAAGSDVNHVVVIHARCAVRSIEWAS